MRRGVYFDAWFSRQHCYHPSLPPRRLRMIDDLVDYRANVLVWAAMGGGSLALPYLEQEAFGEVSARDRFYGFVNDSEFLAACHERGIKVFGIVFEAQGWEFPVELDDDESTVLALNELRGVGKRGWLGLREFSQHRYPKLWPPPEQYFPGGLRNSLGEPVTDLIEECGVRDIHQRLCRAHWVECPDREHVCTYMDRNNPVWREYLKAVIRIQIDAGVNGIQLDEAELPLGAMQYGACFCKDCIAGFRAYLRAQPRLAKALDGVDLDTFHYGEWLLERGHDFKHGQRATPLFGDYYRFQCGAIRTYFKELADYARAYARSLGREVLVSGNFFNVDPHYLPLADECDLIITEMRNTTYRQPEWYRFVAAFAGDRDVVVVENPYGGVVPELVSELAAGRGHDLFRLSLYEGAAFGANMSVPYGSWMGSRIEDAFYAPHDLTVEVQSFLADNDALFSKRTYHEVAVVYNVEGNRELVSRADTSDNVRNARDPSVVVPYRVVTERLSRSSVPFDVVLFTDGVAADDRVTAETLAQYRTVILPSCETVTERQEAALRAYAGTAFTELPERLPDGPQAEVDGGLAVNVHRLEDGSAAVHLLDYEGIPRAGVRLSVRLPFDVAASTLVRPNREPAKLAVRSEGGVHTVVLDEVNLYAIVVFTSSACPDR
jgi:hypothetical protein